MSSRPNRLLPFMFKIDELWGLQFQFIHWSHVYWHSDLALPADFFPGFVTSMYAVAPIGGFMLSAVTLRLPENLRFSSYSFHLYHAHNLFQTIGWRKHVAYFLLACIRPFEMHESLWLIVLLSYMLSYFSYVQWELQTVIFGTGSDISCASPVTRMQVLDLLCS